MDWTALGCALGTLAGAAGIAYVVSRDQQRTAVHWLLLALLTFAVFWTSGLFCIQVSETETAARLGFTIAYFGACGLAASWVLLCGHLARSPLFTHRPGPSVAVGAISGLFFLACATNDGHRQFASMLTLETIKAGPRAWAGPIFWAGLVWSYGCVAFGLAVLVRYVWRAVASQSRWRGVALAVGVSVPTLASLSYYLGLLPDGAPDPTPVAMCVAIGTLFGFALRHRLLHMLPFARRDVIEHLAEGVVIADASGSIVDVNPPAERLLRASAARLHHRGLARAVARLAKPEMRHGLERVLDDVTTAAGPLVLQIWTADDRSIEINAACVRGSDGEPTGQFAVLRDRSDARRYEKLCRESQRRGILGEFAAGVAHEVNNPLAFVGSNLRQIRRAVTLDEGDLAGLPPKRAEELRELAEVVDETMDGVDRITRIVERIISPPELRAGQFAPIDLNQLVQEAIGLAEFDRRYVARIELRAAPCLPPIEGCSERLSQALLNLIVNAQRAMAARPDGRIVVETATVGDAQQVKVIDGGHGLPEPVLQGLFDPGGGGSDGHGSGVAVAYQILQEHGGSLEVESREGFGTTFTVRLPARRAAA